MIKVKVYFFAANFRANPDRLRKRASLGESFGDCGITAIESPLKVNPWPEKVITLTVNGLVPYLPHSDSIFSTYTVIFLRTFG